MNRQSSHRYNRSTVIGIIVALAAGLSIGGFLFYRILSGNVNESSTRAQKSAATIPAVSSETTQSQLHPPPEADVVPANTSEGQPTGRRHSAKAGGVAPISSVGTAPALIAKAPSTAAPGASVSSPVVQSEPQAAAPRPQAVQETQAESSPVPLSPMNNEPVAPASTAPNRAIVTSPAPAPEPVRKPLYDGPMAGMATWTGKLEKNSTLTISGGTPSIGVLSGAGLPGVPVRVTIDQTNLGFLEMPSASNGYRKLVLKSHATHDKITIHWTVVQ
jgi:hypothetical protein